MAFGFVDTIFVLIALQPVVVKFAENEWRNSDRSGSRAVSRADLLTVLSNLQSVLVRATLRHSVSQTFINDVSMDTAVKQQTQQQTVEEIEGCVCPSGYRGTSCEVNQTVSFM